MGKNTKFDYVFRNEVPEHFANLQIIQIQVLSLEKALFPTEFG